MSVLRRAYHAGVLCSNCSRARRSITLGWTGPLNEVIADARRAIAKA